MNLYQAFGMNPVNFRDPMGTELSADTIKYWGSYEKALKYVKYNYGLYLSGGDSADTAYKKLVSNGLVTAGDQVFALKLALSPSLDVFDVTPAQFGKDLAGGVISAGTKLGSLVAKGLPGCSNQYLWAQIDKAQNLVQSKINKAIGANEGSLGYWIGETYAPVIAGGWLSAEIELANATAQTGKTLPFLSKPVVSESNLELANALEGLGFEGKQIERIIAARESGQPLVLIGEFQPRVDKMAGFLDKLGLKIQRYVPRNEVAGVTRGALEANRGWLRYWTKKKGGLVIDLGPIPGNVAPTRQFYIVEHGSIYKNWKYKNFIKFKSKF